MWSRLKNLAPDPAELIGDGFGLPAAQVSRVQARKQQGQLRHRAIAEPRAQDFWYPARPDSVRRSKRDWKAASTNRARAGTSLDSSERRRVLRALRAAARAGPRAVDRSSSHAQGTRRAGEDFPGPLTGVRLFLEGSSGRQELPLADPALGYVTISVDARQSWSIVATKDGYPTYRQAISFEDGQRDKTYTVTFTRATIIDERPLVPAPLPEYLNGERVQSAVARYTPSVKRACWQSALDTRERDAPTTARVNVKVVVLPSGSVQTATAAGDPRGYKGLSACVAARVRGWQFPSAGGTTTINIPFVFAAQ